MKRIISSLLITALSFVSCKTDDDATGNQPSQTLNLSNLTIERIGGFTNGSGNEGYAEISAFDPITKKLFVVNPVDNVISVWDISNPNNPVQGTSIALTSNPNSVSVNDKKLAVALENSNKQNPGYLALYKTDTQELVATYNAGALPDMVTFSPDGKYLISANEGEPNDDYTVDPEGSVTVVELENGVTHQLNFTSFNGQTIGNDFRVFGPNASLAQDVEPEYITVSSDSKYAYVSLQENNGMAVVNLETKSISSLFGLGTKNHNLPNNMIDASNKDDIIGNFKNWPVYGFYQPDAIDYVSINGVGYIVSANEGDARDYDGYSEEERIKDLTLDPTVFPNAAELQELANLGRLKTTTANGDVDGDGDYDKLYSYGARSFSIWATDGTLVYDSGDIIGKKNYELNSGLFNCDDGEADGRSDDKGAEPEAVTTLRVLDKTLLFVGLERTGGAMVFNITNPTSPEFVSWVYETSDVAPEGLLVIPANESPNGKDLLIITNEVSNTISIYELNY
ncbi:choice-of-anchor I family protein [Pseudofulvibacter geojedonensis]|uniref:Choice-of-anchor I family protein n=1 Tax=Pseudofulvibacter geojedonensis TaxID=1123758 RepID=A0ABW3I158_9FLAO